MGNIFEEIEVNGKKIKVKVDTGSDFPLCLRKEVIEELKLPLSPVKAKIFREEQGKTKEDLENVWLARIKIQDCEFGAPQYIVEAFGEDNLLGHPILQALGAVIDEEKERLIFDKDKCPRGSAGGMRGEIVEV